VLVGDSVARTPTETPTLTAYAARAIGAMLSLALVVFGLYATNRVTPISYCLPVEPVSPPSETHSVNVLLVEASGTAPES